jgi:hypothetical protein
MVWLGPLPTVIQPGGEHTGIGRSTDLFCSKLLSNANVPTLTSTATHRLALDEWFLVFLILISSFKLLFVYLMSENAKWIGIHTLYITMRI